MAEGIVRYAVSAHARRQMRLRRISADVIRRVMLAPDQRFADYGGREILQARLSLADGQYLVRVFVDVERALPEVVTVYRTSKIAKYWRP